MKNIVLTGFMGTGKSEVGRILAEKLYFDFIDSDSELEREQKMSITEIFKNYGETFFRDIESNMIERLSEMEGVVISTGGGVVLRENNIENLKKKGVIVCLTASAETILRRVQQSNNRPLLQVDNPLQKIKELLSSREQYYRNADITISTEGKSAKEIASEILRKLIK